MPNAKAPRKKRVLIPQELFDEAKLFAQINGTTVDKLFELAFGEWLDRTSADPKDVLSPPGPNDQVEMKIHVTYDTKKFLEELAVKSGHAPGLVLERAFRRHIDDANKKNMEASKPKEFKLPLKTYNV